MVEGEETAALSLPMLLLSIFLYAVPGATIGLGQWFELRNLLPRAGWWILATAGGWVLGFGFGNVAFSGLAGLPTLLLVSIPFAAAGLFTGLGQWMYLRLHWSKSHPWVPIAVLVLLLGGFSWLIAGVIGGAIGWVIAGAVSGYCMLILRDRSLMS